MMVEAKCGRQGSCVSGFYVGKQFHVVSCEAVRPELVSADVLAAGMFQGAPSELRRIEGVDPTIVVAVRGDGGKCGPGDEVLGPWSVGFVGLGGDPRVPAMTCAVLVPERRTRSRGCS